MGHPGKHNFNCKPEKPKRLEPTKLKPTKTKPRSGLALWLERDYAEGSGLIVVRASGEEKLVDGAVG
jgi:hypothetical protein